MKRIILIAILGCLFTGQTEASFTPPVQEVQRQAMHYAGLSTLDIDSWKRRVAWNAALPQLRVSVQRDLDEQFKITNKDNVSISGGNITIGPDEQDFIHDFDAGTRVLVTAVWYLDRIIFNRDRILVSQERRRINEERFKLLDRVTQNYYEREAAIETLQKMKRRLTRKERLKLRTLIKDRTARLDADTGGWFSEAMHHGN